MWSRRFFKLNNWLGEYQYLFQLAVAILTVVIAFLAAYYGYKLTDNQAKILEKEKVIKLLQIAINDLQRYEDNIGLLPSDLNIEGMPTMRNRIRLEPVKSPEKFPVVINNDLVMKWVSAKSYSRLVIAENNFNSIAKVINEGDEPDRKLRLHIAMYKKELECTRKIIETEIKLLSGAINQLQLQESQEFYSKEVIKFQEEETKKLYGDIDFSKVKRKLDMK